jgi:hypothetical protein
MIQSRQSKWCKSATCFPSFDWIRRSRQIWTRDCNYCHLDLPLCGKQYGNMNCGCVPKAAGQEFHMATQFYFGCANRTWQLSLF